MYFSVKRFHNTVTSITYNSTLEFLEARWLHFTGDVDKFIIFKYEISSGLCFPRITKIWYMFDGVILKSGSFF